MLQAKTEEQRRWIENQFCVIPQENCVAVKIEVYSNKEDELFIDTFDKDGTWHEISIPFDTMKRIVDFLKFRIRKGYVYKCKKDVYDSSGEVLLFNNGEFYLSPEDNMLLSNNNLRVVLQEWHHPEDCFVEEDPPKDNDGFF